MHSLKTHSKTIVLQDYSFYLLVFFLSLLLFTVPRCKTIVFKAFADFPIGFTIVFKNQRGGMVLPIGFMCANQI